MNRRTMVNRNARRLKRSNRTSNKGSQANRQTRTTRRRRSRMIGKIRPTNRNQIRQTSMLNRSATNSTYRRHKGHRRRRLRMHNIRAQYTNHSLVVAGNLSNATMPKTARRRRRSRNSRRSPRRSVRINNTIGTSRYLSNNTLIRTRSANSLRILSSRTGSLTRTRHSSNRMITIRARHQSASRGTRCTDRSTTG